MVGSSRGGEAERPDFEEAGRVEAERSSVDGPESEDEDVLSEFAPTESAGRSMSPA